MKRILIIAGTRPEVIKLAPVVKSLKQRSGAIETIMCSTGQHREMLDQMMAFFNISPEADLDLMRPGQTPTEVVARAVNRVGALVAEQKPDWVIVQGDTSTAMAASIAAFYGRARVAHVEAGLRTQDPYRPFPEEMNRRIVGRTASLHFPPTVGAQDALLREGITPDTIHVVGNTVIDALFETRERLSSGSLAKPAVLELVTDPAKYVLVTSHRRENFDQGIADICSALAAFAKEAPDWTVLFPVHPNPEIRVPVKKALQDVPSVHLIDPLGYGDFIAAMDMATFIVTDSGGVQEEGAALGKPVVVMREETERPEAIENGNAVLVGANTKKILEQMRTLAGDEALRAARSKPCLAYGDGKAADRIADVLEREE